MSAPVEPRHDAPLCECGEGVLVPAAYSDGTINPGTATGIGDVQRLRELVCTASGETAVEPSLPVILQAWWSVGAHEQHLVEKEP